MTELEIAKLGQVRLLLQQATATIEKSKWIEEYRDDILRTMKYVDFYLGFHFPGGPAHGR